MTMVQNPDNNRPPTLAYLDVKSWRIPTDEELRHHPALPGTRSKGQESPKPACLGVRSHLSPVDMFCYLKARFGEPNGFQDFLRSDNSDNLVHWDYVLKAGAVDVWISGLSREIQFVLWAQVTDEDWRDLILAIKTDFQRVAQGKSAVLKTLEPWVIFPNKYVEIGLACAELYVHILGNANRFRGDSGGSTIQQIRADEAAFRELSTRSFHVYRSCLQLGLLTPVLAEAFINMTILMLCKKEVRDNKRQFEAFIRSHIDAKIFDLAYKCEGFAKPIDPNTQAYKNFKRVMDKRNNTIHGNCDPEKEQIQQLYFEGTRPLFTESGDHLGKFFEALERQYQPETVVKDYQDTDAFLSEIKACLKPDLLEPFNRVMGDPYPGYDVRRKKMGSVLPRRIITSHMQGDRYDDELAVVWG